MTNRLSTQVIDEELLSGYLDNLTRDIVIQMIALYSQQSIIYLADIEKAALDESNSDWHQHCHKMKGAAASAGLKELHGKLVGVEHSISQYDEKKKIIHELNVLNKQGIQTVEDWLTQQGTR